MLCARLWNFDGQIAGSHLVAIMGAMNKKAARPHGLQTLERLGNPVDIRQHFALDFKRGITLRDRLRKTCA